MLYKYVAVSSDNTKQTGVFESQDENTVREKLNNMGLSVLSVEETDKTEETTSESETDLISYEFIGIDWDGNELEGTIEADEDIGVAVSSNELTMLKSI